MSDAPFKLRTEQEILTDYLRENRRRLTASIAPLISVLAALSAIMFTVFLVYLSVQGIKIPGFIQITILDGTIAALAVVLWYSGRIVKEDHVDLAAGLTVGSIGLTILLIQVLWVTVQGLDPYVVLLFTAIDFEVMLVGVMGRPRSVIIASSLLTVYTIVLWMLARPAPSLVAIFHREIVLLAPASIMVMWGAAILQLTTSRAANQTLRDLGEVRLAYERGRKLDELKDQFISSVNHELRNPLGAMLSFLEILELSVGRVNDDKMRSLIADANQSGTDLRTLVDSILSTRRLDHDAHDFTPAPVNLRASLEQAARMIDPREGKMVERDLRVNIPADLAIWGEQVRLQQILTNLLSNAIKYSPPGSPVEVSARVFVHPGYQQRSHAPPAHLAEIAICDHGLGVPPDEAPLLFQRFVRLPRDLASNVIGNGLGLHLCKTLAEAMGGAIRLESSGVAGAGTTFFVSLPLPPTAEVK